MSVFDEIIYKESHKIVESKHLWYIVDTEGEIVQVAISEQIAKDILFNNYGIAL